MGPIAFLPSLPLTRLVLLAQGEPASAVQAASEEELARARKDIGQRISTAVALMAYAEIKERERVWDGEEEEEAAHGMSLPLARMREAQCMWLDPRLARELMQAFPMIQKEPGNFFGKMVSELHAYAASAPSLGGDYGELTANTASGMLCVDLSKARREPLPILRRNPA